MFRLGLWLKMMFIAISMVSSSGILVKRYSNISNISNISYIVGNKKFSGKIFILNLRNNKYLWKSNRSVLTMKEDCRGNRQDWNNWTKFRKWIIRIEFVHFRSAIDTSSSRTRRIQFIIFVFIKKDFLFQLT